MKQKRFIISSLLILMLIIASAVNVFAAEDTSFDIAAEVTSSSASLSKDAMILKPGDTVNVSIKIEKNPGISVVMMPLTYDATALEYQSYTVGGIFANPSIVAQNGNVQFIVFTDADTTATGTLVTYTFKIKDGFDGDIAAFVPSTTGSFMNSENEYEFAFNVTSSASISVHSYGAPVSTPASCFAEGKDVYTCSVCQKEYVVVTGAQLEHTPVIDAGVAATCTQTGLTEGSHCSICDHVIKAQEVIPMAPHTEAIDAAVEATCTKTGLTEGKHCSVCGFVIKGQEKTPFADHTEVIDPAVEANCTTPGKTEGKHCSVCGFVIQAQEVIANGGHKEVIDAAVEATCTKTGLTEGKHCSVCNEVLLKQDVVPLAGHSEVVTPAVSATCTEAGKSEGKHCSVCNTVLQAQTTIPSSGHTYGKWTIIKEATEDATGLRRRSCTVCGTPNSQTIPKLSHKHTLVDVPAVAPTCEENGLTAGQKCTDCGNFTIEQVIIPATGHSEKIIPGKDATCKAEGLSGGIVCENCPVVIQEQTVLPKTDHKEVIDAAVAATCTTDGKTEGSHCDDCGEVIKAQETIPATGHTFGEWVVTKEATVDAEGAKERTCACGEKETEVIAKLERTEAPKLISGTEVWVKGSDFGARYTTDGASDCLVSVKVDGNAVEYEATGNTQVTIPAAELEKLDAGDHKISIEFNYGTVETNLEIQNKSSYVVLIVIIIAIIVAAGAVAAFVIIKKKKA